MYPLLLVRYGELGLKGRNRRAFEDRLLANMRRAIREVPHGEIKRTFGRIYLETKGNWEELAAKLQRVFGIVSSPRAALPPRSGGDQGRGQAGCPGYARPDLQSGNPADP